MKKILIISTFVFTNFCYSQTPLAPTNFNGVEVTPGMINFGWTDNSDNENGFIIEEKRLGLFSNWALINETSSNINALTLNYELEQVPIISSNSGGIPFSPTFMLYYDLKNMQNDSYQKRTFRISSFKTLSNGTKVQSLKCTTVVNKTRWDLNLEEVNVSPLSIISGSTISIKTKVSNVSDLKSNNFRIYYMLSTKPNEASTDVIWCENLPSIEAWSSINHEVSYTIPATYIGSYYINVIIYSGIEKIGLNNFKNANINILDSSPKPDLAFVSAAANGTQGSISIDGVSYPKFYTDDSGIFDFSITNKGTSTSSQTDIVVYISKDDKLSSDDQVISGGNDYIPAILLNSNYSKNLNFYFPYASSFYSYIGKYWLIGVVDVLKYNNEKDESNNTKVLPIYLTRRSSSGIGRGDILLGDQDIAMNSSKQQKEFKVYPNPCKNNLNVAIDNNDYTKIEIIDVTGRVVLEENTNNRALINLNFNNFGKGIYTVVLRGKSKNQTEKIIIN